MLHCKSLLALLKVRKSQKIFFSSDTARAEIRWFFEYLKTRKNSSNISGPLYFLEEFVQNKLQPCGNLEWYLDNYLRYYVHQKNFCSTDSNLPNPFIHLWVILKLRWQDELVKLSKKCQFVSRLNMEVGRWPKKGKKKGQRRFWMALAWLIPKRIKSDRVGLL